MNLFFKSYKFYLFFLFFIVAKSPLLLGHVIDQEYSLQPEILQLDIPAKYNRTPNTSFCRNNQGIVFIGKEDGFLTIDNEKIFFTPSEYPVYVSLSENNKVIYLCENDFGTISYNIRDGLAQQSMLNMIPSHARTFFPQGIIAFNSRIFLCTTEGIFVLSEGKVEHFFFNRLSCSLFPYKQQLLLKVESKGVYKWNGQEFEEYELSSDPDVRALINKENSITLFGLGQAVHSGLVIEKNQNNELRLLAPTDSLILPLTNSDILPIAELQSVFMDKFQDIWLIYDFSIFKIEYPSNIYTLDLTKLISGTILNTLFFKESMLLASTEGLYIMKCKNAFSFAPELISSAGGHRIHLLSSAGERIIAAGGDGIYEVENERLLKIGDGNFSFISLLDPNTILACSQNGLIRFNYSEGHWKEKNISEKACHVLSSVNYENKLWLLLNDLSLISIQGTGDEVPVKIKLPEKNIVRLLVFNNELLLLTDNASYKWNKNSQAFEKKSDTKINDFLELADLFVSDSDQLWSTKKQSSGNYALWCKEPIRATVPCYEIPPEKHFGQIIDLFYTKEYLWLVGNKKLLRLNRTPLPIEEPNPFRIQNISITFLNKDNEKRDIQENEKIRFRKNRVSFNLKPQRFLSGPNLYYRYKLTHYQDEWSDWSRNSSIAIENLHERAYVFEAQAMTALGQRSKPVVYGFIISPPVYRHWLAIVMYTFLGLILIFLFYKWRLLSLKKVEFRVEERIRERMASVLQEKEKSDKLVEDLFPKGTAEEIKTSGRAKSKKFDMATVLFSDIQGFTKIAEEMNPEVLIDELDKFFFHFDSVVEKYNIEKIKTIGDAYMAAGGIPVKNSSNPVEVVLAGLEMQYYMNDLKKKKTDIWDLRIGIHTGPIISGVVGSKKLSYDIWGDTVNTASRMESSGEGGKVNISGTTYSLIKDYFLCEYRGKLPVKYKGNIDMYFVTGLRPELSVDLHGIPNKRFFIKLQLLKLKDVEERLFEDILSEQILNLHFHKPEYIRKVYNQIELLSRSEGITDDELLLLLTSSLMLYSGMSATYENYENKSVEITRNLLPEFGYDARQIDRVCNLILAAKEPFKPQNKLEEILVDSIMEYLGRSDYVTQVKLLYLEEKNLLKDVTVEKMVRKQSALLQGFSFHTLAAQRLREVDAETQIKNLNSWK